MKHENKIEEKLLFSNQATKFFFYPKDISTSQFFYQGIVIFYKNILYFLWQSICHNVAIKTNMSRTHIMIQNFHFEKFVCDSSCLFSQINNKNNNKSNKLQKNPLKWDRGKWILEIVLPEKIKRLTFCYNKSNIYRIRQ